MSSATPFIGIGAMRAGTTWLSRVLASHPDCRMPPFKEVHFFDVRYGKFSGQAYYRLTAKWLEKSCGQLARRLQRKLECLPGNGARGDDDFAPEDEPGWSDSDRSRVFAEAHLGAVLPRITKVVDALSLRDIESYARYMKHKAHDAGAFGEITPAYSLLPAAAFAEMDMALPGVRFLFVMRDPIERLWSQARYRAGLAEKQRGKQLDPAAIFDDALNSGHSAGRSDYRRTIQELESVIPKDRIVYLFYETMTSVDSGPREIRRIEEALGLRHVEVDPQMFDKAVNASPPGRFSLKQEAAALERLRSVYEFVEERFGRQPGWRICGT